MSTRPPDPSHGHLAYLQIPALDVLQSSACYEAVLQWRIERPHPSFEAPGLIGQWVTDRKPAPGAGSVIWVRVDRLSEALALVRQHGGVVITEPYDYEDGPTRTLALIRDPAGNDLGLVQHQPA